jgi:hypothetical protein
VRLVHTRADGRWATSDAVVHANQRAEPNVDTATSVAPADRSPPRYIPHTPIGSRPAASAGVDRASTWNEISRRCLALRTVSRVAR